MNSVIKLSAAILICSMIIAVPSLWALWVEDGVPICTFAENQYSPMVTTDGEGGAIIAWLDYRGSTTDVYAQRIDATGSPVWTTDGVLLGSTAYGQGNPEIISDGDGGAIITWAEFNGYDYFVYAQHVNASGVIQWSSNGITACESPVFEEDPQIVSDGDGGAIITWVDYRNLNYDIYAQRIDAFGTRLWTANGAAVCTVAGDQSDPRITSDGSGGAIVMWEDYRSGTSDVYAQRIIAGGALQWTTGGVPVCTATDNQVDIQITSDDAGGAIAVWRDLRNPASDIFAQRIDDFGSVQWTTNGIPLCAAVGNQYDPYLSPDGASGAVAVWYDNRSGVVNVYLQRVDHSGTAQWTPNGIRACSVESFQYGPKITTDGEGISIVTWYDTRSGDNDIYAQRIDPLGTLLWSVNGIPLCTATDDQTSPRIISHERGGAIVSWHDMRGVGYDIYAQQIDSQGRTGYFPPVIHSVIDVPGDEGGRVNLAWDASTLDYISGEITEYTVWRAIETPAASGPAPDYARVVSSPAAALEAAAEESDVPILRLDSLNGEMLYWELVSTHTAYRLAGYASAVPTLFDSTSVCDDYHYFQVIAHSSEPSIYFISETDSGYSVDNLSPCPPLELAGEQFYSPEGLALTWDPNSEPDLGCYRVYRGTDESFVPGAGNLLIEAEEAEHFDDTWSWDSGYYYKLSAVDIHGNESGFALLSPGAVTGTETPDVPAAAYLSQNYPNPFNPVTTIEFGLSETGPVSLRIYDPAGRLIAAIIDETMPAGHYSESWDGLASDGRAVSSGVYFYKLDTGSITETRKMILLR